MKRLEANRLLAFLVLLLFLNSLVFLLLFHRFRFLISICPFLFFQSVAISCIMGDCLMHHYPLHQSFSVGGWGKWGVSFKQNLAHYKYWHYSYLGRDNHYVFPDKLTLLGNFWLEFVWNPCPFFWVYSNYTISILSWDDMSFITPIRPRWVSGQVHRRQI